MASIWEYSDDTTAFLDGLDIRESNHDNCVYYNSTNHKIILDTYEGIPQNLILNFIAWLVSVL